LILQPKPKTAPKSKSIFALGTALGAEHRPQPLIFALDAPEFALDAPELNREHLTCSRSEDFAHVGTEALPQRKGAGMQKRHRRALKRSSLTRLFSTSGESVSSAD
jgi:hypothetical protein